MRGTRKTTVIGGLLLVILITACSLFSSSQSISPTVVSSPTNNNVVKPTSTRSSVPSATKTPQTGLQKDWTIKTGDLQYFGVSADGTVYGAGRNLYAIISKDGEVLQTNDVDLSSCLRDNFSGGSGDMEIDRWFSVRPDGTMITTTYIYPCIITPSDPPAIKKSNNADYFPYADDVAARSTPSTPSGFMNNFGGYLYFSRLDGYDFFISTSQKRAAFVDHNAELRYFDLPDDIDLDKRLYELRIAVTPWDDVYFTYPLYDSLGNDLGQKNVKIEEDGSTVVVDSFPSLPSNFSNSNDLSSIANIHPFYLPEKREIYLFNNRTMKVYDLDFNYLREHQLPTDFPTITNGIASRDIKLFVGHDDAVYVFDTSINGKTLTKFSAPINSSQTTIIPTSQSTFESESGNAMVGIDGATLVYIPEGEFTMGSDEFSPDAQPVHTVNLSAFWIDQTEVTNKQFAAFVNATGYQTDAERSGASIIDNSGSWMMISGSDWQHPIGPGSDVSNKDDYPVVHVSWNDATAYCSWAERRLPTEAEWEKAASWNELTQEKYLFPWGNQFDGSVYNFCDVNCPFDWAEKNSDDGYPNTSPVGTYPRGASSYGVLDMAGNVWEWVNDWYSETYYQISPISDPSGPDTGDKRVQRGGSFHIYRTGYALTSNRGVAYEQTFSVYDAGFRCAVDKSP